MKRFGICLLVVVVHALSGFAQTSFYDHELFSLSYPSDWTLKENEENEESNTMLFITAPVLNDDPGSITIASVGLLLNGQQKTRKELMVDNENSYRNLSKEGGEVKWKFKSIKEGYDENGNYFIIEAGCKSKQFNNVIIQYVWVEDGKPGLVLTLFTPTKDRKKTEPLFLSMVKSFVIK